MTSNADELCDYIRVEMLKAHATVSQLDWLNRKGSPPVYFCPIGQ